MTSEWFKRQVMKSAWPVFFPAGIAVAVLLFSGCAQNKPEGRRPNIIVILADDMGYSDIGCFGSEINTPNLDKLAYEGMRMTHFYNAGRCCPSRAALLTGLYPHQAGVGDMLQNDSLPGYTTHLNTSSVTLGEVLQRAGYHTIISGKWHVGNDSLHWPTQRGFSDQFFSNILRLNFSYQFNKLAKKIKFTDSEFGEKEF